MERLTAKFEGQNCLKAMLTYDRESDTEPDDCVECGCLCEEFMQQGYEGCPIGEAYDRLAAYEDTGFTPEQIMEIIRLKAREIKEKEQNLPEQNPSKTKYAWTYNRDDEVWHSAMFGSIEECIKDAIADGMKPGEQIAVGICEGYEPHINVDALLDRVSEDAYEAVGEVAEGWPYFKQGKGYEDADKLQKRIDEVFRDWLSETGQTPGFFRVSPLADLVTIPAPEGSHE